MSPRVYRAESDETPLLFAATISVVAVFACLPFTASIRATGEDWRGIPKAFRLAEIEVE